MTEIEYEKKRGPIRKAVDHAKAAILWLKNRKSSRAVKRALVGNQLGIAALTASVAAAGVGGYATLEARQAQDEAGRANEGVAGVQQRLDAVENDVRIANVALAEAQYDVEVLKDQTAQGMRNLRNKLAKMMLRVDDVARSVASLPAPEKPKDYTPAIERAQRLADNAKATALAAQNAATKAQNAAVEAQKNATDPQARQAAVEARVAAQEAQETARDAADAARDLQEQINDTSALTPQTKSTTGPVVVPSGRTDLISMTVSVPTAGHYQLSGGAYVHASYPNCRLLVLSIDGRDIGNFDMVRIYDADRETIRGTYYARGVADLTAGEHELKLSATAVGGCSLADPTLSAQRLS